MYDFAISRECAETTPPCESFLLPALTFVHKAEFSNLCSRTQPLYSSDDMAPCEDVVMLLAAMAEEDGALASDLKFSDILESLDRRVFERSNVFVLPANTAQDDTFVFRLMVRHSNDKRFFHVSPSIPLKTDSMRQRTAAAGSQSGFSNFSHYSLRRLASNALNRGDITEDDRRAAVGHRLGSCIFREAYMSKRTTFDMLGLVRSGEEHADVIEEHGLRRVLPAKLTANEILSIELKEDVIILRDRTQKVSQDPM